MRNIKSLSLIVQKLWRMLKFFAIDRQDKNKTGDLKLNF